MNNSKSFIVFALILGAIVAVGQMVSVFVGGQTSSVATTADSIVLLPEALNVEQLQSFTERAEKYLVLTPKQFEDGVDPSGLEFVTPTPTPTP